MNKKIEAVLLAVTFCFMSAFCFSQSDTTFFDSKWKNCTRKDAMYYRQVSKNGESFVVRDIYISNNMPQMISLCSSAEPLIKNGKCTFYRETGKKDSQGMYEDNKKVGVWTYWDKDGSDSSIADYKKDDTHWIRTTAEMEAKNKRIYNYIEQMPEFPGGSAELVNFLSKNIRYPVEAKKKGIEGKVVLQFVVEEDGSIGDIQVIRDVGGGCAEEAVRVVKMMPPWKPGKQNGNVVKVYYKLPINFTLGAGDPSKEKESKDK